MDIRKFENPTFQLYLTGPIHIFFRDGLNGIPKRDKWHRD